VWCLSYDWACSVRYQRLPEVNFVLCELGYPTQLCPISSVQSQILPPPQVALLYRAPLCILSLMPALSKPCTFSTSHIPNCARTTIALFKPYQPAPVGFEAENNDPHRCPTCSSLHPSCPLLTSSSLPPTFCLLSIFPLHFHAKNVATVWRDLSTAASVKLRLSHSSRRVHK